MPISRTTTTRKKDSETDSFLSTKVQNHPFACQVKQVYAQKSRSENGLYREKKGMLKKLRAQKFAQLIFKGIKISSIPERA